MFDARIAPAQPDEPRLGLTRARLIAAARGWIGTPYQHQASLRGIGCDCLGLLRGVWRECLGAEPERLRPYGPGWAEASGEEALLAAASRHLLARPGLDLVPGAVLLFRWRPHFAAKHCAIAVDRDRLIHAHDGASVAEITLSAAWRRRLVAAFDFPFLVD